MFKRIDGLAPRRTVTLQVEGRPLTAADGDTLALALLQAGVGAFRETPVSGAPRAPLCLMGSCFDCLVQVDGQANVQACMVRVKDGMQVQLQHGARSVEAQP
jgi:predicted molibdopterin-dependent oxidoreductase YjgC